MLKIQADNYRLFEMSTASHCFCYNLVIKIVDFFILRIAKFKSAIVLLLSSHVTLSAAALSSFISH